MAEQLRVERRDDGAGPPGRGAVGPEGLAHGPEEMVCMGPGPILRGLRVVRELVVEGERSTCDPPVPEPAGPLLAVELEIRAVPGITVVRAPHLDARPRIPREDGDPLLATRDEGVRLVRGDARRGAGLRGLLLLEPLFVGAERRAARDKVGVHEEVPEAVAGEGVLKARAVPGPRRAHGAGPPVPGAIRTLREPDPARRATEVPTARRAPGPDLCVHGLRPPAQPKRAVRPRGRDHLDVAVPLEPTE